MSALPVPAKLAPITADDVAALTTLRLPRWQTFVASVASGSTVANAVRAAGYQCKAARQRGEKLLQKPPIAAALATVRAEMAKRAQYGMDKLIVDLDSAMEFARHTENANALARCLELKGKALGLLVDRMDLRVQQIPFKIVIAGIDERPAIEAEAGAA
ncbi:MAG: terminase small subunit [Steroidobacteraceae bacterium]